MQHATRLLTSLFKHFQITLVFLKSHQCCTSSFVECWHLNAFSMAIKTLFKTAKYKSRSKHLLCTNLICTHKEYIISHPLSKQTHSFCSQGGHFQPRQCVAVICRKSNFSVVSLDFCSKLMLRLRAVRVLIVFLDYVLECNLPLYMNRSFVKPVCCPCL